MLKSMHRFFVRLLVLLLSISLGLMPMSSAYAQLSDSEPPVLIHRQLDAGVAGELQTFLARVSDDFAVSEVVLRYRQRNTGEFQSIEMRPLVDSIGEYMIAIETADGVYPNLEYYIEAFDEAGNKTNRGFDYAPIVIPLTEPVEQPVATAPQAEQPVVSEPEAQSEGFSITPVGILIGVGALLALGALAAGGGSDDDEPSAQMPGIQTPATVTLTVVTDQPSAE